MKRCNQCGFEKHEFRFYRDKSKKDGLRPNCKECYEHRRYLAKNKDIVEPKKKSIWSYIKSIFNVNTI